jgi:D-arabinose 1-dehydrogenase-like Zn-dependent alcohol dehydrogenase
MFSESDTENGTIADYFVADETFLFKIPPSMSSKDAAPLQCAGATTYAALVDKVSGGDRVGILGIGGLGHLAIQFASKLGGTVVVVSSSRNKEAEAKAFGADEFFVFEELDKITAPLDILLITGSAFPPFERYVKTLDSCRR